ncbi:L domain-like protein [Gonapodya prolifera JEL478]|uniref:Dynein axonemal light chain 1 n=1 Tax=Gonapodya prolifera (strain JEL478) TaxID=1344416 RepID=A0A139AV64_GONPJ|nr:L domain-like protein [Gonapodya prolifera JEL478]|eukprot:KXS20589.1 L domain-like protein [Gonapodya prolifera JEL478]
MSKFTIKDALKTWEEKTKQNPAEATVVKLMSMQPFLTKMDAALSVLVNAEQLSLSTNQIDKISNLQGLAKLRVLSLGRNAIKKIEGLEPVADTLEELWISYNQIERLSGVEMCKKLKVLYASNNKIKGLDGIVAMSSLPALEDVVLIGNPLEEKMTADGNYRDELAKKFPQIKRLDGKIIMRDDPGAGA